MISTRMIRPLGLLIMMGWGAGCGDPLGWRDAAGCCITNEEQAVCGDVADDYVEERLNAECSE